MKEIMDKVLSKEWLLPASFLILPFMIILVATPKSLATVIVTIHVSHHYALFIFGVIMATMFITNRWLSAMMIYACIWTMFILAYSVVYPQVPQAVTKNAFDALTFLLVGALIYAIVIKSAIKNETFYNIICISALLQAGISLCQYLWFDPFLWIVNHWFHMAFSVLDKKTLVGTLGNNNFLAAYLAISLPFFFRKWWIYGLILIMPCLYLANTTSAIVPALIGGILYLWLITPRSRFTVFYLAVMTIIIGLFAGWYALFQHTSITENQRWQDWMAVIEQVRFNLFSLFCGFGPGAGWGKPYPMHNEWLQCLHQYGLIGLSLLVGYVATAYRGNKILFTAFVIAMINMFGNYSLHLAPSAFLIIIIVGLMEREKYNEM
jgi:hypothetical protein